MIEGNACNHSSCLETARYRVFDDAGHRMVPTHATKAGVRYRYYVSTPFLHGEAKTGTETEILWI